MAALVFAACGDDAEDAAEPVETVTRQSLTTDAGQPYPTADLMIRHVSESAGVDDEYQLSCTADVATLSGAAVDVEPEDACAALVEPAVVERLVEGPPEDQLCTEQYGGDDVASIEGTIEGSNVDATVDRTDGCGISTWDDLLADVLPPAVGLQSEGP